jgi:hypothetical protein
MRALRGRFAGAVVAAWLHSKKLAAPPPRATRSLRGVYLSRL